MKRIAVSGVSGFVENDGCSITAKGLQSFRCYCGAKTVIPLIACIDAVVHLAGKAHQMEPIDDQVVF